MALVSINCTVEEISGQQRASADPGALPVASLTEVDAAITTALGVAAADHDSTDEINDIQTAVDALELGITGDIAVTFDRSTITTTNQFDAAVKAARAAAVDAGILS